MKHRLIRELATRRRRQGNEAVLAELRKDLRAAFGREDIPAMQIYSERIRQIAPASLTPVLTRKELFAKLERVIAEVEAESVGQLQRI